MSLNLSYQDPSTLKRLLIDQLNVRTFFFFYQIDELCLVFNGVRLPEEVSEQFLLAKGMISWGGLGWMTHWWLMEPGSSVKRFYFILNFKWYWEKTSVGYTKAGKTVGGYFTGIDLVWIDSAVELSINNFLGHWSVAIIFSEIIWTVLQINILTLL